MWFYRVSESNDARLQALWNVVQQLPQSNLDNLRYLVKFLALLSQNQEVNSIIGAIKNLGTWMFRLDYLYKYDLNIKWNLILMAFKEAKLSRGFLHNKNHDRST